MNEPLKWVCGGCKEDVAGKSDAVIHVRYADIAIFEDEAKRFEEAHPSAVGVMTLVNNYPHRAEWRIHCWTCNPHKLDDMTACNACFIYEVNRLASWSDLIALTAHLMGKRWLPVTNWDEFLRQVLEVNDNP